MLFDPQSKKPLFKLAYDQVGASQALDVAREHGLPEAIVHRAEHYLLQDGQDASALLGRLNDLAARREEELAELRAEQEKARRAAQVVRERLEKERGRLYEEVRGKAAELMRAWKEGRATHKQALKEMSRLRASLVPASEADAQSVLPAPQHFAPGQSVLHSVFNKCGVITDVDERRKRVRLDMNGVSLWAEMKDLREGAGKAIAAVAPARARPSGATAAKQLLCVWICAVCARIRPLPKWSVFWTRRCWPVFPKWKLSTGAARARCVAKFMSFYGPFQPSSILQPHLKIAGATV